MNRQVTRVLDPEGAHLATLRRLADFRDQRVLELGCGDGRLTIGIAADAANVLAFDPDAEAVGRAPSFPPPQPAQRGTYQVASRNEIHPRTHSVEPAVLS